MTMQTAVISICPLHRGFALKCFHDRGRGGPVDPDFSDFANQVRIVYTCFSLS